MSIFEIYINKIKELIKKKQKNLELTNLNDFKNVTVEVPPNNFDSDLSCNVSLILGKINKKNPKELAEKIKNLHQI